MKPESWKCKVTLPQLSYHHPVVDAAPLLKTTNNANVNYCFTEHFLMPNVCRPVGKHSILWPLRNQHRHKHVNVCANMHGHYMTYLSTMQGDTNICKFGAKNLINTPHLQKCLNFQQVFIPWLFL